MSRSFGVLGFDPRSLDELNLLLFAVPKGGGSFQRVEVVFVERFLSNRRSTSATPHASARPALAAKTADILHLVHISGHEFNPGLLEGVAALIVHRDPADHVQRVSKVSPRSGMTRL